MDDQKIENLLNLSLDATQEERRKSESLETGYDERTQTWEVIVRYNGNLQEAASESWDVELLSGGYAIVRLPGEDLEELAALPQTEYIEKPKRMYFSVDAGRRASCISALQTQEFDLFGREILVAVIDSGVDYFHPDFRNDDGSTRILALWDQTAVLEKQAGRIPEGFVSGVEYTREDINRALTAAAVGNPAGRAAGLAIVPEQDLSGHGTQVLGIATGNGRASGGRYRGVAPLSDLLVVKLGQPQEDGFPNTTELMRAVEYVSRKAEAMGMPVAVNISFGNVYGSHRGTSLLETYIDMMAARGRTVIVAGTGNEGNSGGHVSGNLLQGAANSGGDSTGSINQQEIELLVGAFETSLTLQIWKNYTDDFQIQLISPEGRVVGPFGLEIGASRYQLGETDLLIYYGEPSPYQIQQEIYLDFIPKSEYIESGVWKIRLTPQKLVTGEYQMWLNDGRARNPGTRFQRPTPDVTMTIPSSAAGVIAVGAYDADQNAYASFSGRGWEDSDYGIRPDLAAPGVDITTTAAGGGYVTVTGTSFAAPFVTGSAALLMEWGEGGIIRLRQKSREISGFP